MKTNILSVLAGISTFVHPGELTQHLQQLSTQTKVAWRSMLTNPPARNCQPLHHIATKCKMGKHKEGF